MQKAAGKIITEKISQSFSRAVSEKRIWVEKQIVTGEVISKKVRDCDF
jgi:hypothetical protein